MVTVVRNSRSASGSDPDRARGRARWHDERPADAGLEISCAARNRQQTIRSMDSASTDQSALSPAPDAGRVDSSNVLVSEGLSTPRHPSFSVAVPSPPAPPRGGYGLLLFVLAIELGMQDLTITQISSPVYRGAVTPGLSVRTLLVGRRQPRQCVPGGAPRGPRSVTMNRVRRAVASVTADVLLHQRNPPHVLPCNCM